MTKKQIDKLVSTLCKREAKKSQIKAGDMREALGILADLVLEQPQLLAGFVSWGLKRLKKKGKK